MCVNVKFISSVDHADDISRVGKANESDIFNRRNIFHISYFKASRHCSVPIATRNKAVNSDAFYDNRHM